METIVPFDKIAVAVVSVTELYLRIKIAVMSLEKYRERFTTFIAVFCN
jgi:hypothetical protein